MKEERKLYTLKPITGAEVMPPPTFNPPVMPASKPPPVSGTGPVRTKRTSTARMQTGPMPPALKARILADMAKAKADKNQVNLAQVTIPPIKAESAALAEPAEPIQSALIGNLSDNQPPLNFQPLEYDTPDGLPHTSMFPDVFDPGMADALGFESDFSDSLSYASTLPGVFEVDMDDLAPAATGPWEIIDHFTGEIIVDEALPAVPVVPGYPFDSVIRVEVVPTLGITALVQTPLPTLCHGHGNFQDDFL